MPRAAEAAVAASLGPDIISSSRRCRVHGLANLYIGGAAVSVQASQVRTTVKAAPAEIWKALTTLSTFKQFFFGSDILTDWRVGNPIRFRGSWKGKPYEDKGSIQTFDIGKRLAFTHWSPLSGMEDRPENYHILTFELRPKGGGTEVVLTQTNQNDAEPLTDENRKEYAKNWTMVLDGLKKAVERTTR